MSSARRNSRIRRADPELRAGRQREPLRPFGLPKPLGAVLFAFFSLVLLIPRLRQARRRKSWNRVRFTATAALGTAAVAALAGFSAPVSWWAAALPTVLAVLMLLLPPSADPDAERKLQARHGADYLLNGGRFVDGRLPNSEPLPSGAGLYLLVRGRHLLIVPRDGRGEAHSAIEISRIQRVLVEGKPYVPVYIPEAKDPPVKEESVDRRAKALLELELAGGEQLRFLYEGAFAKHMAETAAHAVYSIRRLEREGHFAMLRPA